VKNFFQVPYVKIVKFGLQLGNWQLAYVEKEKRLLTEEERKEINGQLLDNMEKNTKAIFKEKACVNISLRMLCQHSPVVGACCFYPGCKDPYFSQFKNVQMILRT
jgi:hypothetical protein